MSDDALLARVQRLWSELAGVPVSFLPGNPAVVTAPHSKLCPPSWIGIVTLDTTAIVTAPTDAAADRVRRAVAATTIDRLTDEATLRSVLPVADVWGPATLAYVSVDTLRAWPHKAVEQLPSRPAGLQTLLDAVGEKDAAESGLAEITSPAFIVREGADVIAVSGYRRWPGAIAHMSVLTAPEWRDRHLARRTASAAVSHALIAGLLPQWRARPAASLRVARALGFRILGTQLSFRLDQAAQTEYDEHSRA